ncbi:unnamed protein product [marine sediment metagenome]|uniref:Uncharacterized protein n=1 Tax=marine sediment metagenome TaxID=412755 RepID=X1R5V0_9ZZZZ
MPKIIEWFTDAATAANTAKDGTGAINFLLKADVDTYIDRIVFRAAGSNVASVARLWLNTGETNTVASNNTLLTEITLPATTLSETSQLAEQKIVADLWLPAGYRLAFTLGTAVSAGYLVYIVGGTYQDLQSNQGTN